MAKVKVGWWDEIAGHLQQAGRSSEATKGDSYSEEEARRAAVYTREDLILVVSHLSSLNRQIASIKNLLILLVFLVACLAIRFAL